MSEGNQPPELTESPPSYLKLAWDSWLFWAVLAVLSALSFALHLLLIFHVYAVDIPVVASAERASRTPVEKRFSTVRLAGPLLASGAGTLYGLYQYRRLRSGAD